MKTTIHSGRMAHFGHNDRKNTDKETHIDKEKSSQNFYWTWNEGVNVTMSFRESEKLFYETQFGEYLEAKNKNTGGHSERVQTMEQYMTSRKSVARETLYYIGNAKEHPSEETIKNIVLEQINWQQQTFPQVGILSIAYHVDEEGAPHFHEREVFQTIDRTYGKMCVNGKKCLEDMNIPLPEPDKPEGKYNNRLMTYTKLCREHFQELCRNYGLEIETEPTGKGGLSLMEYKISEKKNLIEELDKEIEKRGSDLTEKGQELDTTTKLLYKARNELTEANKTIESLQSDKNRLQNECAHLRQEKNNLLMFIERLDDAFKKLKKMFDDLRSEVKTYHTQRHEQKFAYGMRQGSEMANTADKDSVAFDIAEGNLNRAFDDFYR